MCLVMVDDHGLVWLFMRPACLPPPLLLIWVVYSISHRFVHPLDEIKVSYNLIMYLWACVSNLWNTGYYKLQVNSMKEEAWKKSSRSRISTKEAFKLKVDCLRQFFFSRLSPWLSNVVYLHIYDICGCANRYVYYMYIAIYIYTHAKWDLHIKYPHFENFKFENVKY